MNILFSSHAFYPNIGGIETVSWILAHEFVRQGHKMTLITQTPAVDADDFPFKVIRRPKPQQLLCLVRNSDVYFHNNISVSTAWPLLFIRKPWVVTHQTWLSQDWKGRLKRCLLGFAMGISISRAIADNFPSSTVIPNPYDDDVFYEMPGQP